MSWLERLVGRPEGVLGQVGAWWMARRNRATIAWVVGLLDLAPGQRILELGFGPGVGIETVLESEPNVHLCGVDPSAAMRRKARQRNQDAIDAGRADLRAGVAEDLPFEDGGFDRVFAVDSLNEFTDPSDALAEAHRVLAPDGRIALGFTPGRVEEAEGLTDELTRAGFQRARRRNGEQGACVLAET